MLFAFIYLNYGMQEMHTTETKFFDNLESAKLAVDKLEKKLSRTGCDDATLIVVLIKDILKYRLNVEFDGDDGVQPVIQIKGGTLIHQSEIVSE